MSFFTKKPVTIEARQFETNNDDGTHMTLLCDWANEPKDKAVVTHDGTAIYIATLEGTMRADCGDWLIRGVKGEIYPCKPDIFEETYAPAPVAEHRKSFEGAGRGLTFGQTLEQLKDGDRIAREGWNGKGMWLSLSGPLEGRKISAESFWSTNNADFAQAGGGSATVLPCITMKTATGEILMGWLASQTDMLAEDWMVVSG